MATAKPGDRVSTKQDEDKRQWWDNRHQNVVDEERKARRVEREARERLTDSDPFRAAYFGECADCLGKITPGDEILRHPDGSYAHADAAQCDETTIALTGSIGPREQLCGACFCYHAGECA